MPHILASSTMLFGFFLLSFFDNQINIAWPTVLLIMIFSFLLFLSFGNIRISNINPVSSLGLITLRTIILIIFSLEIFYFGMPILGSIPYNEFGFKIFHFFVGTSWLLILINKKFYWIDLAIPILIGVIILNRQLILLTFICLIISHGVSKKYLVTSFFIIIFFLSGLGVIRNSILDLDYVNNTVPFFSELFFIYLYLIGPFAVATDTESLFYETNFSVYWNTSPEWIFFSNLIPSLPEYLSYFLFYFTSGLLILILNKSKVIYLRDLSVLIFVLSFVSFFSSTLISLEIIATFLILFTLRLFTPNLKS